MSSYRGRDLTVGQVKSYVAQILKGHGPMIPSGHVKKRMREREFTTPDIEYVLEHGNYTKGFWDADHQNHEFGVTGHDLDGEELEMRLALNLSPLSMIVVTGKRARP